MAPLLVAMALSCVVTLLCPVVGASGPRTALDKDAARTLVQQGDERMAAKDYRGALRAYRGADDIMGVPTTSIEVGRVELLLKNFLGALVAFERAAAYPRRRGEPRPFARARQEAKAKVRELSQRIARLGIEVRGVDDVATLTVAVDDEPVSYPLTQPLRLNPALYVVSAEAPGYVRASETIELAEGAQRTIELSLMPAPSATVVAVDRGPWPAISYTGFAVAGVGMVAGTVTGVLSLQDANAVQELCEGDACPESVEDQLSRSLTLAHISTASFVVGGVGAALGLTALLITPEDFETAKRPVEAAVELGWARAQLRLRF